MSKLTKADVKIINRHAFKLAQQLTEQAWDLYRRKLIEYVETLQIGDQPLTEADLRNAAPDIRNELVQEDS